jgi:MFS superfamily sulfate permease-like transporter
MYRFGAALFYANAGRFLEEVSCVVEPMPSAVRWVVVDAEAMTHVDYSAARVVMALKKNLTEAGVELAFARAPWDLRSDMDRHHLTEAIGPARIFNRLHDALAAYERFTKAPEGNAIETSPDSGVRDQGGPLGEK